MRSVEPQLAKFFAHGDHLVEHRRSSARLGENLEDNAAWIWLFTSYTYTATASNVDGFVPMVNGSLQYLRTTSIK